MAITQRKSCAFCGRTDQKITKEHVWPEWTVDCLISKDITVHLDRKGNPHRQWKPKDSIGITVNEVCRLCNNGWMRDLEETVRPFLCPMISSTSEIVITTDQLASLSMWAYKILLVADLINPVSTRTIPRANFEAMYASKTIAPLSGLLVWFASYVGPKASTLTAPLGRKGLRQIDLPAVAPVRSARNQCSSFTISRPLATKR
jgi:hypothetical protein